MVNKIISTLMIVAGMALMIYGTVNIAYALTVFAVIGFVSGQLFKTLIGVGMFTVIVFGCVLLLIICAGTVIRNFIH